MIRHLSFVRVVSLALPLGLWLFLFYPIVVGRITIVGDTAGFYAILKFFIDNLLAGTFALWDPFLFFGFPLSLEFLSFGVFNPIWLFMGFLCKVGVNIYLSFVWTYIGYFFIGQIGFFLLARILLRSFLAAYVAFLLLLFSFVGMYIFTSPNSVFIFVPAVWFFYFFIRFWKTQDRSAFVGVVFTLMIIASCYLPFYWSTVFMLIAILYVSLYMSRSKEMFARIACFARENYRLVIFCSLALGLTLCASFKGLSMVKRGEVLAVDRKISADHLYEGGVDVAYEKAAPLCLTAQIVGKDLFFRLDAISACFGVKYVSIFAYCILLLSFFNRVTRKGIVLFLSLAILFFVAIGDQTPMCKAFFYFVPFFKFIHAIGFFWGAIGLLFVLFVALHFKLIAQERMRMPRYLCVAVILSTHLGLWLFLRTQPMLLSTHLAICSSLIFFSMVTLGRSWRRPVWLLLLVFSVIVQPVEVLWRFHDDLAHMDEHKERIEQNCAYPSAHPQFSFVRPDLTEGSDVYDAHRARIQMKDAIGFPLTGAGYPPRWSYYIFERFPLSVVGRYTKYKFYLYDNAQVLKDESAMSLGMEEIFSGKINLAIVSSEEQKGVNAVNTYLLQSRPEVKRLGFAVTQPSEEFRVRHFDVNTLVIETHFTKEKFLVYTDSFHPDWKAKINGERANVYRANIAFKGVLVPAGKNVITFYYAPLGGQRLYWFILGLHVAILGYLVFAFWLKPKMVGGQSA